MAVPHHRGDGDTSDAMSQAVAALREINMAGEQFRQAVAAHFGIGVSDSVALSHLAMTGPSQPRELAEVLGLTPSSITALLDRLEAAGLADRRPHPTDRRKTVVTLTCAGVEALTTAELWMRDALRGLDERRLAEITANLSQVATGVRRQTQAVAEKAADRPTASPAINRNGSVVSLPAALRRR